MCSKDPCDNIARALVNTCNAVGDADFTCQCQSGYSWDDDSNSCKLPGTQAEYMLVVTAAPLLSLFSFSAGFRLLSVWYRVAGKALV